MFTGWRLWSFQLCEVWQKLFLYFFWARHGRQINITARNYFLHVLLIVTAAKYLYSLLLLFTLEDRIVRCGFCCDSILCKTIYKKYQKTEKSVRKLMKNFVTFIFSWNEWNITKISLQKNVRSYREVQWILLAGNWREERPHLSSRNRKRRVVPRRRWRHLFQTLAEETGLNFLVREGVKNDF